MIPCTTYYRISGARAAVATGVLYRRARVVDGSRHPQPHSRPHAPAVGGRWRLGSHVTRLSTQRCPCLSLRIWRGLSRALREPAAIVLAALARRRRAVGATAVARTHEVAKTLRVLVLAARLAARAAIGAEDAKSEGRPRLVVREASGATWHAVGREALRSLVLLACACRHIGEQVALPRVAREAAKVAAALLQVRVPARAARRSERAS